MCCLFVWVDVGGKGAARGCRWVVGGVVWTERERLRWAGSQLFYPGERVEVGSGESREALNFCTQPGGGRRFCMDRERG